MIKKFMEIGKTLYNTSDPRQFYRMLVFVIRSMIHFRRMEELIDFFNNDHLFHELVTAHPWLLEQGTRQVFYRGSNVHERIPLIKAHFVFAKRKFTVESLRQIYLTPGLPIWEYEINDEHFSLALSYRRKDRKEGLMSLLLKMGERTIYQVMFWFAPDPNGQMVLWIGALQGSKGGAQTIRDLTKAFFGYRPKNMMLYGLRVLSDQLGVNRILAVSNYGVFENNHFRLKHHVKTSLDEFWLETGGKESADRRFFELPIAEPRKNIEEIESHKRNSYRKRYAALDTMNQQIRGKIAE